MSFVERSSEIIKRSSVESWWRVDMDVFMDPCLIVQGGDESTVLCRHSPSHLQCSYHHRQDSSAAVDWCR